MIAARFLVIQVGIRLHRCRTAQGQHQPVGESDESDAESLNGGDYHEQSLPKDPVSL